MPDRFFIDTNIWVYAKIAGQDSTKHRKAVDFLRTIDGEAVISSQVIAEFANVLGRFNVSDRVIQGDVETILGQTTLVLITAETLQKAFGVKKKYRFSFFDSLIVASALLSCCGILYSEDLQDGQMIDDRLRVQNPLIP